MKNQKSKNTWLTRIFGAQPNVIDIPRMKVPPPPKPQITQTPFWKVWRWGERVDQEDLRSVTKILPAREEALEIAINGLRRIHPILDELNLSDEQIFALASTDVFVEKAQRVLTRRSRTLYYSGVLTTLLIFFILGLSIYFVYLQVGKDIPDVIVNSYPALIFRIFQSIALSAFVLVTLKWLLSLTRSFFHEALSLLERRHALRYGRLYVYLRKGTVEDQQLIEAFQWNKETRTSFLDIKPEVISETLLHKALDILGKLPPETVKAIVEARKDKNGKSASGGGKD